MLQNANQPNIISLENTLHNFKHSNLENRFPTFPPENAECKFIVHAKAFINFIKYISVHENDFVMIYISTIRYIVDAQT